jgi:hypothetical protein
MTQSAMTFARKVIFDQNTFFIIFHTFSSNTTYFHLSFALVSTSTHPILYINYLILIIIIIIINIILELSGANCSDFAITQGSASYRYYTL